MKILQKNDPRTLTAWCMYDWANSVYSLVITSAIFPIYYSNITGEGSGDVSFFGLTIDNTALYSYALSFSFLIVVLINPLLTALADYSGRKKDFMRFFCYLGALSCASLWFFTSARQVELAIISSVGASVGFAGSMVFYNAYLPEIATEDRFDKLSARGFALGYIGSVLLLVFNLLMILQPQLFGNIDAGTASRLSFVMVGIWWAGFAQITFSRLPQGMHKKGEVGEKWWQTGWSQLQQVWQQLKLPPQKTLRTFLLAFFLYNTGVQTIMYMATLFGQEELNLPSESLIITILLLQLIAIGGAYLFSWLSAKLGNIQALIIIVGIWVVVAASAYFVYTEMAFYALAGLVGLVMGGVQSLSRATYAKLIPENTTNHASFFNFYEITEKTSIVIGTAIYGLVEQITGSMRMSSVTLALFFVSGMIVLAAIRNKRKAIL